MIDSYPEHNRIQHITSVGYTESHILYMADIMNSLGLEVLFRIFDNQDRFHPAHTSARLRHEFIDSLVGQTNCVFALSTSSGKRIMFDHFNLKREQFINLIHARASVSTFARLGNGVRIDAGAMVSPVSQVGDFVNIKQNVIVGHHVHIGAFSTIQPMTAIAGGSVIGSDVVIGIGANLINDIVIGDGTIVGAGSVVTRDLPAGVLAFGNPCRVVRKI
jgi:sugar O-acyltransferase (sialic acid O-acetyltransferase NeuD family)